MKENERKRRVLNKYSFYDRTHIQQYLESMAEKGWMLEKITNFYWQFKRIEPQKLHFSVNYFPEASEFDPEPSEQLLTIRDFCAHSGWEFVVGSAQMQIYCNAQDNPVPIETDPVVEVETIHKAMKKNFLPSQFVLLGLAIFELCLSVYMFTINPIGFFTQSSSLFSAFCWVTMAVVTLIEICGYLRWHKKAKLAAELDSEFVSTPSYRRLLLAMLYLVLMLFVLWVVTLHNREMTFIVAAVILVFIFIFVFTNFLMKFMKRKKVSAKISRVVTIGVSFAIGFALMIGVTFGCIQILNTGWLAEEPRYETYAYQGHNFRVYHDELPLTVADLMETDYEEYSMYWEGKETFLLGEYDADQHPRMGALGEPSLRYTVYHVKWGALYDMCLQELLHQWDDREQDIPAEWKDYFRAIDAAPWKANAVYQQYTGDVPSERYILCYDDVIVQFIPGWQMTDEQKGNVAEKLNK